MDAEIKSKTNGGKFIPEISKHSGMLSGRSAKHLSKQLFENLSKDNRPETKAITTEEHEYRKNKD
jgi:hypothetical protein